MSSRFPAVQEPPYAISIGTGSGRSLMKTPFPGSPGSATIGASAAASMRITVSYSASASDRHPSQRRRASASGIARFAARNSAVRSSAATVPVNERARMRRVRVGADDDHPGQRVVLVDLGVADRLAAARPLRQLAVEADPLLFRELGLLLGEPHRHLEEPALALRLRHHLVEERQV